MSEDPLFVVRGASAEIGKANIRAWIQDQTAAARRAGATYLRVSWTPEGERPELVVIEGWAKQPDDEGAPRFKAPE
jgi:hypothetical protein